MYRIELTIPLTPFLGYRVDVPLARREGDGAYLLTRGPNGQLVRKPLAAETR